MTEKPIKAKVAGKVATLSIDGQFFYLTEQDCRRLRAEMNRCIQRFVDKRGEVNTENVNDR